MSFHKITEWGDHLSSMMCTTNLLFHMYDNSFLLFQLFAAIGEAFEEPNVVGVVVSIRSKEDAVSIWTRTNQQQIRYRVGYDEVILSLSSSFHD